MDILSQLRKQLFLIRFSQEEVDALYAFIPFDDEGMEIWAGENVLEKNTLWFIYSEINHMHHLTPTVLAVKEALKTILYPSRQEESTC